MCSLSTDDKKEALLKIGRFVTIPLKPSMVVIRFSFNTRLLHSYSFEGATEEECIDRIYTKVKEDVWKNCE